jgi:hypothetical protein
MPIGKKPKGVEGSIFGLKMSDELVSSLSKRFPGEPLKVLGKFMKLEIEIKIALSKTDKEVERWENARKELSKITGMSFNDILDEKDQKALKEYAKGRNPEKKNIAKVYKNLRERLLYNVE